MASTSHSREPRQSSSRSTSGAALRKTVASTLSPETILDIVQRLGLMDMVVDRLRARVEETDIDAILDDIGDYLKRNPEVIVVALGTITVMAGVLVYLERREGEAGVSPRSATSSVDWDEEAPRERPASIRPAPRRKAS